MSLNQKRSGGSKLRTLTDTRVGPCRMVTSNTRTRANRQVALDYDIVRTFKYDPFGRRIYKSSSSATSVYAYDGDNLIEETNSSGAVGARYEPTQNTDEPLALLRSGATSYFH